jgi:hypothetical protein
VKIVTCDISRIQIADALTPVVANPTDGLALKAARKVLASNLKAIEKAIAIVCPPKKEA